MEIIVRFAHVNPWSEVSKWANCYDFIGTYVTRSGMNYSGLTAEDARRLEKELNYPEATLAQSSTFWQTYAVKLGSKPLHLDTDKPEDELKYLFLKSHKRVAQSLTQITKSTDYVLINKTSEAEVVNRINKTKREAYREMDKMSLEEMRKCLRVFGIKSDNLANELVEAKLSEQIESDPNKFLQRWVNNLDKELLFVIEEALSKNIIRKNKTQYLFGTDTIGNGIDDTIAYLKDKKNNDIKMAILNETKSK